jgi:SNF2 family DNA or RNA helicase
MSRHKARAVRYDGSLSAGEKERAKDAFMKGDADLFIANQAAGGTGLNLAGRANAVLYYSNSFSSLDRWQSEDRTHRIGTKGSVTYVDLVARGTTDTAILANLRRKREVSDMTLNEIRDLLMVEDDV